jgi:hypothetical protein
MENKKLKINKILSVEKNANYILYIERLSEDITVEFGYQL